jgi:hypothetical protein
MTLYSLKNVTKIYGEKTAAVTALKNIDLDIPAGKFVVILGPSGSGKSTLLNLLGGMDVPTSGHVFFQGTEISNYDAKQLTQYRRRKVGFVFQSYNLLADLTAQENVEFSTEIANLPRSVAIQALTEVGLAKRLRHYPSEMSGGEQQRVSIARGIAKQPAVLLCDEPTGALDHKTGVLVLDVLHRVHENGETSVIVITHNQDIARIADLVIYMKSGEIEHVLTQENPSAPNEIEW